MPNLTPPDVHVNEEVGRRKRRRKKMPYGIQKHGHPGEPGYELLHPGRGKKPTLPSGWTGSAKEGVFHGPEGYRLSFNPGDGPDWTLDRQHDARGRKFDNIGSFKTPEKAYAAARGHLRAQKKERQQRVLAEAAHESSRAQRILAANAQRAKEMNQPMVPIKPRKKGERKPARNGGQVTATEMTPIELPGIPDPVHQVETKQYVNGFKWEYEKKYAAFVHRLANKGIGIDPTKRQQMSAKYGVPLHEMVAIENGVYARLFPKAAKKPRVTRTWAGATAYKTGAQDKAADLHGGRRVHVLFGDPFTGKNESVAFKATKGPHRGKFVKVSWNGNVEEISAKDFGLLTAASAKNDVVIADRLKKQRWSISEGKWMTVEDFNAKRVAEENAREVALEDLKREKARKISVAQAWAKSQGFDPEDSYWWGFYWRDNTLVKTQHDDIEDGTRAPLGTSTPGIFDKPSEMIPAKELNLGKRRRPIKGWRVGKSTVIAEHSKSDYRVYNKGRQVGRSHPTRISAIQYLRDLVDRILHPRQELQTPDISQFEMRGRKPGPARDYGVTKIFKGAARRAFDETKHPRNPRGSGDKSGEFASVPALRLTDSPISIPKGTQLFHHGLKMSNPTIPLKRLPRGGKHMQTTNKAEVTRKKIQHYDDPRSALYDRNNGSTIITNRRLQELWGNPMAATPAEMAMILSAGGQNHIDGSTPNIKVTVKSSGKGESLKSRAEAFNHLRGQFALGSGDRSAARIAPERRAKMNQKRAESNKNNDGPVWKKMNADFTIDGKNCFCFMCGRKVDNRATSMETLKPKEIGGKYEDGQVVPTHRNCNTEAQAAAQKNALLYYEESLNHMGEYLDALPLATRKRVTAALKRKNPRLRGAI